MGDVVELNIKTGKNSRYIRNGLIGIDKAVSFLDEQDNKRFAVAKKIDNATRRVTIYDEDFRRLSWFDLPADGVIDISVSNFHETAGLEIAVAPKYNDTQLFRVYTMDGDLLYQVAHNYSHNGVSVAALASPYIAEDSVLVLTSTGVQDFIPVVRAYENTTEVLYKELDEFARGGTIAAGDIDADGEDEFIIGSGKGQDTSLRYYELDGTLKSQFFGYNPGFTGGINAQILDYDNDGDDDVLISALDGSQPVRVWNREVKRLANWYPFGEDFSGSFFTIISF